MNSTNYTMSLNTHSLTKRRVHSVRVLNADYDNLNKTDAIIN